MSSVLVLSKTGYAQKDALERLLVKNQWLTVQQEPNGQLEARVSLDSRNVSQSPSIDGLTKPASKSLKGGCSAGKKMLRSLYQGVSVREVIPVLIAVKPGSALKASGTGWRNPPGGGRLAFDALAGYKHLKCAVLAMNAQSLSFPD